MVPSQDNTDVSSTDLDVTTPRIRGTAPVTPLNSPLTEEEIQRNRTFMTVVHFMMTYPRWSISIFLLLASRSISLPVASQAVRQPLSDLRAAVTTEADLYRECVRDTFDSLADLWNETASAEWTRTAQVRTQNMQVLLALTEQTDTCVATETTARRALQQVWRRDTVVNISNSNENTTAVPTSIEPVWLAPPSALQCAATDRANLTALLGPNAALVEGRVSGFLTTYIDSSSGALLGMADYAETRSAYDYEYFVGLKLEAVLQLLDASLLDVPDISLSLDQMALMQTLRDALQAILDALAESQIRVDLLTARIVEFQVSLQDFYDSYLDLYGRLERVGLFIRDFLPAGVSLPTELDLSDVLLADFLLPPTFALPSFPGDILDVDTLVDDFIRRVLDILTDIFAQLAEKASEQLLDVLQELDEQLRELLTLEDYKPPQFVGSRPGIGSIFDELDFLYDLGELARLSTLNALQQVPEFEPIVFSQGPSLPDLDFRNISLNGSSTSFDYLKPSFPAFSIPEVIEAFFLWIFAYQWIIEVVVQLLRLWRLKRKYEKDATPDLPELDYGSDEAENPKVSTTLSFLHISFLKHFMTPWMALALILLPFSIITVTIWFPHVKTNCIDSRNGTFVARNIMSPLLINEANIPGNAYYSSKELECQGNQRRVCDVMFAESDTLHRSELASLFSATYRYNQSTDNLGVFDRCIETDFLDNQFEIDCCGLEGYASECDAAQNTTLCPIDNSTVPASSFRPLGEYLSEPSCQADVTEWVVEDSRFDCQVSPCTGVDSDLIRFLSIEADCQVEIYIIKCGLLVMLALYHAIMVNLCTTLAFNGVKHLRWRSLRPDGIRFRTQINEDGELVKGGDRDERSARIAVAMKRFELIGCVQIILASVFFVIWFVSFFLIAASIDF
jgi:hypothetical protein